MENDFHRSNKKMNQLITPILSNFYWIGGGTLTLVVIVLLVVLLARR